VHTDIPTRQDIEQLLEVREPHCVSIYLPTSPITHEGDASRIALKNLSTAAIQQLHDADVDKRSIWPIEEALEDLAEDEVLWDHLAHSLAVFVTEKGVRTFRLPNRLTETLEVSDRFHVKPLLRAVTFPQSCFVLALSQNGARLLEISPDIPAHVVPVPGMPHDAASAVGKASINDRTSDGGRIQGSEGKNLRLRQYARRVDEALRPVLAGHHRPLILAATEPMASIFRFRNTYPHLAEVGIETNTEASTDVELDEASRSVLDQLYARELADVRDRYELQLSKDRATSDLGKIARAATYGAVDTVLVDIDETVPGFVDEENGAVTIDDADDAENYGVVDEVARRVLLSGGRVLAVRREDVPGDASVAAILRYAL
jgi:hypothetical protein